MSERPRKFVCETICMLFVWVAVSSQALSYTGDILNTFLDILSALEIQGSKQGWGHFVDCFCRCNSLLQYILWLHWCYQHKYGCFINLCGKCFYSMQERKQPSFGILWYRGKGLHCWITSENCFVRCMATLNMYKCAYCCLECVWFHVCDKYFNSRK